MSGKLPFELVASEGLLVDTRPFILAYFPFYLPSLYLCLVAGAFLWVGLTGQYMLLSALILIPAAVYSFAHLNLRFLINGSLALVLALLVKHVLLKVPWSLQPAATTSSWLMNRLELFTLLALGILGLLAIELYRRSHRYIVTDGRVFTRAGILSPDERTLPISKINDISLDRDFFGAICNYGTLIPLTASGIGMGSNFAILSATAEKQWKIFGKPAIGLTIAGGHSIQVPKSRTHEVLYGVRQPAMVREKIMRVLVESELQSKAEGKK